MRSSLSAQALVLHAPDTKPSHVKLLIFRLLRLACSAAILLAVMEIVLRVTVNSSFTAQTDAPLVPSRVPGLGYRLAANYSKGGVRTDAHGLRWRPPDAHPSGYSVLVMGDSIAYGSGVSYDQSFAPVLESRLARRLGRRTAVWNAAVPGYNTDQESILLELTGPIVKPDLVIVQFCMNDYLDPPDLTPGGTLDATHIDGDSRITLLGLMYRSRVFVFAKEKIKDLQKARPEWFPVWAHYIHSVHRKPGWQRAEAALVRISQTATELDARLLVVVFPVEQQLRIGDRGPQDDLLRFAQARGIPMLDLYDSFRAHWREGLYIDFWRQALQFDKLHLNGHGHALAAEEISTRIVKEQEIYVTADETASVTLRQ
jgi:lysophospholipase L1-like esterase